MINLVAGIATALAALTPTPTAVIHQAPLATTTVMQSFAYDATHHAYYVAQVDGPALAGDFKITKLSATGRQLGHMQFNGFGHAVSFGVQPVASGHVYLWTEAQAKTTTTATMPRTVQTAIGDAAKIDFGTSIAHVLWRNGATVTAHSKGVELFGPEHGYTELTPSVDMSERTITIRYLAAGRYRYRTYWLSQFEYHHYHPVRTITEPAPTSVFQGWTYHHGVYYRIEGEAYSAANPAPGDATITTFDSAGRVTSQALTTAGASLSYREPEGMADVGRTPCYGFASGQVGARRANIYC